jgi:hypothetical protein
VPPDFFWWMGCHLYICFEYYFASNCPLMALCHGRSVFVGTGKVQERVRICKVNYQSMDPNKPVAKPNHTSWAAQLAREASPRCKKETKKLQIRHYQHRTRHRLSTLLQHCSNRSHSASAKPLSPPHKHRMFLKRHQPLHIALHTISTSW